MRTYERGVEAETLSCGTACVALAAVVGEKQVPIQTQGGLLEVEYKEGMYWLSGPVEETFRGEWLASF